MPSPTLHRAQILAAALLFSTGGTVIKLSALGGWQIASFRSGLAALGLLVLMPSWRRWWRPRILAVGAAYAATMILFVMGNKLTTAANTIFLQSTAPMYLMLLGPALLGERLRRSDLMFGATLAAGMALFFVGAEPERLTAPDPFRGNLIAAAAGVSWALTLLGLRWLGRSASTDGADAGGAAVVAGNLIACAVCLPAALPAAGSGLDWTLVAYLGLVQIGLAYVALTRGIRHVPAVETSLLLLLEPVASALLAWAVHAERPGPFSLAGCAVVLGATVWKTVRRG